LESFRKPKESVLLIIPNNDNIIFRCFSNISKTKIILADSLNVVDLLKHKKLLILQEALPVIENNYLKIN